MPAQIPDWFGESVKARLCDILDRGIDALGSKLIDFQVQIPVVEWLNDMLGGEAFKVAQRHGLPSVRVDVALDARLDDVVVPVPAGVVALAKQRTILFVGETLDVQTMRRSKLELLSHQYLGWALGFHFDAIIGR